MPTDRAPTTDELRSRIDDSEAGDKVAYPDPAAAPLGGDDEAAGHPPTAEERALASRLEARTVATAPRPRSRLGFYLMAALGLVVFLALIYALATTR